MPLSPADFTLLYRRHATALVVFFQRRVHDPEVALDLLSDTFAVAIERADQFRGDGVAAASGWLWQIAKTSLRELERRDERERRSRRGLGRRRRALTDEEIERIEELATTEQFGREISRRLDLLPVEQAEAVRLRVREELDYAKIAERLGIDVGTARARVSRGLRALNHMLAKEHETWRRRSL